MDFPASLSLFEPNGNNNSVSNGIDASEIVFIDRGVEDYEFLARGVKPGVEVHLLDADAVAQITTILSKRTDLKAVHVVSHGAPGCLYLGDVELRLRTLRHYEAHLQSWFAGYAEGDKPELLLYGCNVAASDAGEEFLSHMATIVSVIPQASKEKVGASKAGAVWQLDYGRYPIHTVDLFSVETQLNYSKAFAPGDLVTSFGTGGKVTTDFSGENDASNSITIDATGNILVAGSTRDFSGHRNFALVRYMSDGQLDPSFGNGGKVTTDFSGSSDSSYSITTDQAGNILLGGDANSGITNTNFDFALARYTSNGQLDPSFGIGGKITTDFSGRSDRGYSITIDEAGNILLGGEAGNNLNDSISRDLDFALARYTSDGQLDPSFGIGGKVTTDFSGGSSDRGRSITTDAAGNILIGGYTRSIITDADFALVRYTSDGQLDPSFGNGGKVTTNFNGNNDDLGQSIIIDTAGNILIGGHAGNGSNNDFAIARYTSNGQLDTSFGNGGKVTTSFSESLFESGKSLTLDVAGNILVVGTAQNSGTFDDFALVRYTSNGQLDTSFGNGGKVTADISGSLDLGNSITTDAAGNIFVAGYALSNDNAGNDFAIAKFDGSYSKNSISWNTETGVVSSLSIETVSATLIFNSIGRTITDTDWALQTLGDLDGDGQEDVLLRNATSGQNLAFYMNPSGQSIESEALIGRNVEDPNWSIVGTGDFNADGKTDIIWQNQAADQILAWYIDGQGSIESEAIVGRDIGDSNWEIEAVADFGGDGKADMLLRNGISGQIILWEMDGDTIIEESLFGREVSGMNWAIEGARDFDNNGTMDVLLRNAAAEQTVLWSMADKNTIGSEILISNVPGATSQIAF